MFRLFTIKVLFKQINLIILANAALSCAREFSYSGFVTELRLTEHALLIFSDIKSFSVIELFRPATHCVLHATIVCDNTLSVNLNRYNC